MPKSKSLGCAGFRGLPVYKVLVLLCIYLREVLENIELHPPPDTPQNYTLYLGGGGGGRRGVVLPIRQYAKVQDMLEVFLEAKSTI